MKTISRRIIVAGVAATLLSSSSPLTVGAVPVADSEEDFCTRVLSLMDTNQAAVGTKIQAMQAKFSTRIAQMATDQSARDEGAAQARTAAKQQFEQKLTSLLAREGLSEDQVTAIETFRENVTEAEETREAAVDQALETYRSNLANTISAQQTSLIQAADRYREAITTAFTNASNSCEDSRSLATLRIGIKNARQALTTKRNNTQVGDDIRTIAATRREAIKAANEAFRSTIKEFSQTLTAALKNTTEPDDSQDSETNI